MDFKQKRIEKKLSQIEMAKMLQVSLNTYINWERKVTKPNEENYKKVLTLLGD